VCHRAARGERLALIVGDNRLDAYRLARLARARGFDPDEVLQRVLLSRPFTCYQLHHSIATFDPDGAGDWSALYVMGLLELFYDGDIRLREAERLVRSTIRNLKRIAARGLPVLVSMYELSSTSARGDRAHFLELVARAANTYWHPTSYTLVLLRARQRGLTGMP
jgi:hypothetical protein